MRTLLFAGALLGATLLAGAGFAQTAAPAGGACPEGQGRGADGNCTAPMPATPHQMNVLKPDAGAAGGATGAQTTPTPAPGTTMPATPHQQGVLKKDGG